MVRCIRWPVLSMAVLVVSPSYAQQYPEKPIRLIVPFGAGGVVDVVARILGNKLGEDLNQRVVIDNRAGASGNLGTALAAKAPPDGYTLLLGVVSPLAINVTLFGAKLPYNPTTDFAPVSMITRIPQVLTSHPSVPARSLKQLVALAKANPQKLTYGSAGNGTTGNLVMELFKTSAGIRISHIPFKVSSMTAVAVLSGEVDMMVSGPSAVLTYLNAGRLRALAISSATRSPALPAVPTMIESGLPGFDMTSWYCLVAPGGTPRPVIDRLHLALTRSMESPQLQKQLLDEGALPESSTPEQLGAFMRSEIVRWGKAVTLSGARID